MRTWQIAALSVVSTIVIAAAVAWADDGTKPSTGGPPSSAWDGTYKPSEPSSGGLLCPGDDDIPGRNATLSVGKGKVKFGLWTSNPATGGLQSRGCDHPEHMSEDCKQRIEKIKAAGASLDKYVKLGEITVSIDKDGNVYGSVSPKPLPIPEDADADDKAYAAKLVHIVVTGARFHMDNHGRNAGGLGKGKAGLIYLSTTTHHHDATCGFSLTATDYKVSGHCGGHGDTCRADHDCCSHTCSSAQGLCE